MSGENGNMDEEGNRVQEASQNELDWIVKEGARTMLAQALEIDVEEYIQKHKYITHENGHRKVTRTGTKPERTIHTAAGDVPVDQPRVNDEREGETFTSKILPPPWGPQSNENDGV